MATPVILIFDVGKTNKKILLFDEQYQIVFEESTQLKEIVDEDGFACEDVDVLTNWIQKKFREILSGKDVTVKAVNFSAYGASFVNLDENLRCCTPLYNYLKPFPGTLKDQFYKTYGGESFFAKETASPVLGSLNSGMQLYRLKYEKPAVFKKIKYALHLPQYLSFILSNKVATDISSVGCHTNLWHFEKNDYHDWVYKEELDKKFAELYNGDKILTTIDNDIKVGIGLHDSSAALIPYLTCFAEPFILISTGTWCISLNPFNHLMLTDYELQNDCLFYLSYEGKPVKASRLFAGYEHEQQVKKLADHFNKDSHYYKTIKYNSLISQKLQQTISMESDDDISSVAKSGFEKRSLNDFETYEEAYHQLMLDILKQQTFSTKLILANTPVQRIFVDGGFSENDVYMHLLAAAFPNIKVYAANIPQASAVGAALVLHSHFNKKDIPSNLIDMKYYAVNNGL